MPGWCAMAKVYFWWIFFNWLGLFRSNQHCIKRSHTKTAIFHSILNTLKIILLKRVLFLKMPINQVSLEPSGFWSKIIIEWSSGWMLLVFQNRHRKTPSPSSQSGKYRKQNDRCQFCFCLDSSRATVEKTSPTSVQHQDEDRSWSWWWSFEDSKILM